MRTEYKARYCLELSGCGGTAYDTSFNSPVGKEHWKSGNASQKSWMTGTFITGLSHEYFTKFTL